MKQAPPQTQTRAQAKILKASAGTGKTYRLSLEYVAALLQGDPFPEILVMTFTRKATAEIRERVFAHLEDLRRRGPAGRVFADLQKIRPGLRPDPELLEKNYTGMLQNKDHLHIYTIDSFINRLFKLAVAPYLGIYNYEIIEEEKNHELIEQVLKELLDNSEDFALMEKFLAGYAERDIDHYLGLIKRMLHARWIFLLINHRPRPGRKAEGLTSCLNEAARFLAEAAAAKNSDLEGFLVKDFKTLLPRYLDLESRQAREELVRKNWRRFCGQTFWNGNKLRGRDLAGLREEMAARYEEFRRNLAAWIYNTEMIPYEEEIFRFSSRVFAVYDRLKFRKKVFTHADISNYTYQYLNEGSLGLLTNGEANAYFFELLGARVKTVLIDEFQDTNILQWKILKPLCGRHMKVIAVGDEKQSIYGWRGGEKELFTRLPGILEAESESLQTCYRSEKEITGFVNRFFTRLAAETGWEYEKVESLPAKNGGFVEILLGGEALAGKNNRAVPGLGVGITENLKRAVARRIKELPDYSQTVVLARRNEDLEEIAAELDKEDLPYLLESRESLVDHAAVKPLYFLLCYLACNDYLSLVKFLRSDLVGAGHRDLKLLLCRKEKVERFLADREESPLPETLTRILTEIKVLRRLSWEELPGALVESFGVVEHYRENSGALKNIYHFFALLRSFPCLKKFLDYVEENRGNEKLKQVGIKEEKAVRLMTVHKAKGLSFANVFFYWRPSARGGGGAGNMELFVTFNHDFTEVKEYLLTHARYSSLLPLLGYNFLQERREKELAEEINNVYVAMTRAERNLFLYIEAPRRLQPDRPGQNWSDSEAARARYGFFEPALLAGAGVASLTRLLPGLALGRQETERKEAPTGEETGLPALRPYFLPAEPPVPEIERINRNKEFAANLAQQKKRAAGLAAHYYLEHIRYNTGEEKEYARRMVLARFGNILGPERIKEIIQRVEEFTASRPDLFAPGRRVLNEYEIREGDQVYRIDRLLVDEEKKELLILDFKTGETREEQQLEAYRRLVEARTGGAYKVTAEFVEV